MKHLAKPRRRCKFTWTVAPSSPTNASAQDLRINKVLAERKLRPVPGYQPQFRAYPIEHKEIEVGFTRSELREIRRLKVLKGQTDEEIVRAAFMLWYQTQRMRPHWIHPDGPGC